MMMMMMVAPKEIRMSVSLLPLLLLLLLHLLLVPQFSHALSADHNDHHGSSSNKTSGGGDGNNNRHHHHHQQHQQQQQQQHQFACVKSCRCNRQKQIVLCSNEGLTRLVKFSPHVKTLVMDDNLLSSVDFESVLAFETRERFDLVELSLRRNNISSPDLKRSAFRLFGDLRFLHLDGNRLTYLEEGLLDDNPHLERLTLSDNPLLVHDEAAMAAFRAPSLAISLKHLDLSRILVGGRSGELPSFLSNLTALEELIVQNSHIKNTSEDALSPLLQLRNFKRLDLSGSIVESIFPAVSLAGLRGLVELDLSGASVSQEGVSSIFDGLNNSDIEILRMERIFVGNVSGAKSMHDFFQRFNASRLRILVLDGNFMAFRYKLPDRLLHSLHHLNDLFLESCNLVSIPGHAFQGLNSLKRLSLRDNLVSCARGSDCRFLDGPALKHLRHLDFSHNRLSDTENSVFFKESVFPSLEYLDLRYNDLTAVGEGMFRSLSTLLQLDLSHNPIEEVEQNSFWHLSSLTTLNMEACKHLVRLKHGAFNGLASLRVLNLRDSGLAHVHHSAFGHLGRLEELYLRGNKFGEGKDQLQNVTIFKSSLKILDIGENGLEDMPASLVANAVHLVALVADGNRFRDSGQLASLGSKTTLETLDLSRNQFAWVSEELLAAFVGLKSLDLSGNPFACTCSARDSIRWLFRSGLVDADYHGYRCASPPEHMNENVFQRGSGLECRDLGDVLTTSFLAVSLLAVLALSIALFCALRKRAPASKSSQGHHHHHQHHQRPTRMEASGSVYSPLDEEETSRRRPAESYNNNNNNDECHFFDAGDHQRRALVDADEERETTRNLFGDRATGLGNGFFGRYKRSKRPYANASDGRKCRSPAGESGDDTARRSKISSLDGKSLMLEVASTNSLDCDVHVEDSVL